MAQKSYVMILGDQIVGYMQGEQSKIPPVPSGVQLVEVPQLAAGIDPNKGNIADPEVLKQHFAPLMPT
jgi:hypothetical protein